MNYDIEYLYSLLPAYLREKDIKSGENDLTSEQQSEILLLKQEYDNLSDKDSTDAIKLLKQIDETKRGPLKSVLSLFAEQIAVIEENLAQIYDDQFIETCSEWVVPYIGDITGTKGLIDIPDLPFSQRAQVANTIAYRRRKGTAAVVEQLARDVTGYTARVVEYFKLLATTQYLNHLRPENQVTANLRNGIELEQIDTPFDSSVRSVDVRNIESKRGKYNISNLAVYLWQHSYLPHTESPAYKVDDRRYLFDVLGNNVKLLNLPVSEDDISHIAELVNVPHPITRRLLRKNFEKYYGKDKSILIYADGKEIMPAEGETYSDVFTVCNLVDITDEYGVVTGWNNMSEETITIDPELGRIVFPSSKPAPQNVYVTYRYENLANIGGGEYDKSDSFQNPEGDILKVPGDFSNIQDALDAIGKKGGVVEIQDNNIYTESLQLKISAGKVVELRAANKRRPVIDLSGDFELFGGANSACFINGLLIINGALKIPLKNAQNTKNKLSSFACKHITVRNGTPSVPKPTIVNECTETNLSLNDSFLGAIRCIDSQTIKIKSSVIDAGSQEFVAISGLDTAEPAATLAIDKSTVIGKIHTTQVEQISSSILLAKLSNSDSWDSPVISDRLQQGCIRYSYYPWGARIPKPYKCVSPDNMADNTRQPVFESEVFGKPRYCELSLKSKIEITEGSDEYSEMGVYHDTYKIRRIKNLKIRLDEYLPFGIQAGIFLI